MSDICVLLGGGSFVVGLLTESAFKIDLEVFMNIFSVLVKDLAYFKERNISLSSTYKCNFLGADNKQ